MSTEFPRQSARPLRPESIRAAVRRSRKLCDIIERYADPQDPREKAQLTRAIHGLAFSSRALSARHRAPASAAGKTARGGANPRAGVGDA